MSKELVSTRPVNLTMEGMTLLRGGFMNFGGKPTKFNAEGGKRTFAVQLDPEVAQNMINDGWNVKFLEPREEGEERTWFLTVNVKFGKGKPPRIVVITSRGRTTLPVRTEEEQEMVGMVDWLDMANVDMIIRPYNYDVNGKQGISAYLQSIYITVAEDELEMKYANVPEIEASQQILSQVEDDVLDVESWEVDEIEPGSKAAWED